ncbi:MAG: GNAT family N-acetyltransferase [Bacteroidota bacterium]
MTNHPLPTQLSLRRAIASDALALSLLADYSFRATFEKDFERGEDLDAYCQKTFSYAKLKRSLEQDSNYFLLVYDQGELVGYAKLKMGERPVQLQKIYLHPAFLGRGIGKRLLEESKALAKAAGAERLWLAVEERNQNAIAFYQRTEWEKTGTFDFQIGTQLFHFYRMELAL